MWLRGCGWLAHHRSWSLSPASKGIIIALLAAVGRAGRVGGAGTAEWGTGDLLSGGTDNVLCRPECLRRSVLQLRVRLCCSWRPNLCEIKLVPPADPAKEAPIRGKGVRSIH